MALSNVVDALLVIVFIENVVIGLSFCPHIFLGHRRCILVIFVAF